MRVSIFAGLMAGGMVAAWATLAPTQTLDLSITDPALIAAECGGTVEAGEMLFVTCSICHALQEADAVVTQQGPHLESLFGRTVGTVAGYAYSPDLRAMQADGAIWERDALHIYLQGALVPGAHPVIADEQERRDILTYMRTATLPPPPARGELVVSPEVLAMEGDIAYGEFLASGCAGCHQEGAGNVPAITSLDSVYFVTAMHEYRARSRENETMRLISARLTDEEIASLAAYFLSVE